MPKHSTDRNHPAHGVSHYEEGQFGMFFLYCHTVMHYVINIVINILYVYTLSLTVTMTNMIMTKGNEPSVT